MVLHSLLLDKNEIVDLTNLVTLTITNGSALLLLDGNSNSDFDIMLTDNIPLARPLPDGTILDQTGTIPHTALKIKSNSDNLVIRYITTV